MSWETAFFDLDYAALALSEPPAPDEAEALRAGLALSPGQRLLDQGCGVGRVCQAMAGLGVRCLGVDLIEDYARAAERRCEGLPARFVCADAGVFRPEQPVQAVINWHSSFGYRPEREALLAPLRAAFEALEPGGRFALESSNDLALLRAFQPRFVQQKAGVEIVRDSRIDLSTGMLDQTWTFTEPDGRQRTRRGHRLLLTPNRLVDLLGVVGFTEIRLSADVFGAPLKLDSPRVVVWARRSR